MELMATMVVSIAVHQGDKVNPVREPADTTQDVVTLVHLEVSTALQTPV